MAFGKQKSKVSSIPLKVGDIVLVKSTTYKGIAFEKAIGNMYDIKYIRSQGDVVYLQVNSDSTTVYGFNLKDVELVYTI